MDHMARTGTLILLQAPRGPYAWGGQQTGQESITNSRERDTPGDPQQEWIKEEKQDSALPPQKEESLVQDRG